MASREVRLSVEDFENDKIPEVVIEFYKEDELQYAAYVTSSGKLDTVGSPADVDGQAGTDQRDDAILIELANAFIKMKLD
ncbi:MULTISPECIES: hypothetical protein [Pseudomonas]|uniref:Uncharacterized protein n=1 Tax=Pseudomonas viridiflava TaxID=33069 RepID=A0A1Y6JF71_PSEVI|nr:MULTISPECIES: hypothetical protein [Pseudomonas]KTC22201.1 hypothetical protein AO390_04745 [Pseudomonas marginalis ICMP 11289]VVN85697.1 hypothetical protein PS689_01476 [Pseudomonas fluorescens]MBI6701912.1 hypothetical protein [Pseudomonas viridiflava]MBI6722324.1 hypothetical protein [Pseudomonas viridiflava]MBV1816345.1 hypothetical protein [Pseudomonas viridiflava]